MVKVSDVIVEFLLKNNIEVVFGIIGSANSHIYDSINKHPSIKLVPVHHEQAAVMAMGAYYRSSGKMAVALVTAGGGSSNAFTGILSNWADSIPGIIISGQEQSYYIDEYSDMRMYGIQGYDSVSAFSKCTKMSVRITKENIYKTFEKSFEITQTGRPGPIFLEVPFDIQGQMVEKQYIEGFEENTYPILSSEITNIIKLLNQSKKPVVIGGHGVKLSQSEKLFKQFVEKHNLPVILTWSAVDLLEETNPNNYGRSGVQGQRSSNFIIQNCDLLIVMGSRLSLLQTGYSRKDFAPNAKIIHIDIDPTETTKFDGLSINKDVKVILFGLNEYSNTIDIDIKDWKLYCDNIRNKYPRVIPEHLADPTNSYTFIDWFSNKVPDNYTIVTDMGTALLSGFYGFNIKPNQKMFTSLGLGEMGYGLAAAVGAGFGPNPVMCLNCDGGMMMNLQELQTIKTQNLPVKIVIFNNDGYLMIKHTQNMLFNGTKTCVDKKTGVELPDYKKIAEAFEYEYYTIDQVDKFLSSLNQCILEVFMDPNQEFIPKVRGIKNKDNTIQAGLLEEMSPLLPLDNIKEAMISGMNKRSNTIER
jgi:acetolactate synthase I/II/III large subunit